MPTPEDEDAHVLDAGVGEHALEVALAGHEHRRRRAIDSRPMHDQELARERAVAGGVADLVEAQDRAGTRSS